MSQPYHIYPWAEDATGGEDAGREKEIWSKLGFENEIRLFR